MIRVECMCMGPPSLTWSESDVPALVILVSHDMESFILLRPSDCELIWRFGTKNSDMIQYKYICKDTQSHPSRKGVDLIYLVLTTKVTNDPSCIPEMTLPL